MYLILSLHLVGKTCYASYFVCYFVCMHKSTLIEINPRCKVVYVPVLKHCDFKHANLHRTEKQKGAPKVNKIYDLGGDNIQLELNS